MDPLGEQLREAMRRWPTGVAVVTSRMGDQAHGMTVGSLVSISLDPPCVVVTLANDTRTHRLVLESGVFGVTMLNEGQASLSDRFAGRSSESGDRLAGLELFQLESGVPLLRKGLAALDCRVIHRYELPHSTLFVGQVLAAVKLEPGQPLVYLNREYHLLL